MTVSVYYEIDRGFTDAYDDYNLKLGMGDAGTISFSGASSSGSGVDSAKDIVPNAYTPVYELANEVSGAVDNGLLDSSGNTQTGQWGYDVSAAGFDLSFSYNAMPATSAEAETGYSVKYSGLMDGLMLMYGAFDDGDIAENTTYGAKYTMGNVTAAIQITDVDYEATASTDQDASHGSFNCGKR